MSQSMHGQPTMHAHVHTPRKHTVPTHLQMPDQVLTLWSFSLTARQLLLLLVGGGIGGTIWQHLTVLGHYAVPGEIVRLLLSLPPFLLALFIAWYQHAGRYLEIWIVVLVRYRLRPKRYLWRSIRSYEQHLSPLVPGEDDRDMEERASHEHPEHAGRRGGAMKPAREQPGVQRDMVRLRETKGDMLCLYAPGSPTRRSYRAVLEVSPINLSLKAEDEQEAIIERFGALIRSLSFPVQILVRNQRLDLTPYIRHLLAQPGAGGQHPPTWYALAASLAELLQKIAAQRTLIERHVYVIIPASQGTGSSRRRSGFPTLFGKRRAQRMAETEEQARQELALRAEALTQQLASCGLTCHRLHNTELARLFYSCLTPERALAHPLSDKLLSAVGRPTRVKRRRSSRSSLPDDASRRERAPQRSLLAGG